MRKQSLAKIIISLLFIIFILVVSLNSKEFRQRLDLKQENNNAEYSLNEEGIIRSEDAEKIIKDKASEVIQAISSMDFNELAKYVHPEKGLRFTPYTHVDPENDVVFTKEQVRNFFKNENEYLWGHYDGSGKEIRLTPEEYYHEFIYSVDFINAERIGYNEVLSSGNMLENQFKVYNNPIIVEYYFSGFNPDYEGMDWKSLRLVFVEHQNEWKLTGIIHNQWTI
ncbi:hypothetical protein C8C77_103213 [Halanaerobium saccharolyticum]|uniref:Uncharacterized protein n=1 Tax=Halanaerobium saccharolyticum TaxID=43595 RepID=A0A4R7Z7S2_9FIRM|nr:hypothetical protein [Halanaerobium saccharolyticum]RAK11225.1 hypothetical protein C7958_103213 [Halanaerobium saccharolyticum]TDW07076.1 hypothetical protein C8C77_103213 [Halanaerobium saccharolyticum]TDX63841.1 hypothetical protein C7956_102213 [Halanaerobium saccharolyticum]